MRHGLALAACVAVAGCGRFGFGWTDDLGPTDAPALLPDVPPSCIGADEDSDGWPDACDSCLTEPNPDQRDRMEIDAGNQSDGIGDGAIRTRHSRATSSRCSKATTVPAPTT